MTATLKSPIQILALALVILLGSELVSAQAARFRRGDVNDNGVVLMEDALFILGIMFVDGGKGWVKCQDSADVTDDGSIDITDPIYLLYFLFLGGPPIPRPSGVGCGLDPTED